ncbi:MAG: isoprenoid biosynthesis glyoxalase ElbB [Bdellovibrionaceae bacterium]|nr:isoprenoid biosynthesis glyoxalase ElbB [Pseudobdellovibrionaceae bacterium]
MKKNIAVILSGCGNKDGSEITEAVSTLMALAKEGAHYVCFAPDQNFTAVDYLQNASIENRNAMKEAARIARSEIRPLQKLDPQKFDGVVFVGGAGAVKNLSDWAHKGAKCTVLPEVEYIIESFHEEGKPIAAMCIAPTLVARVLGRHGVSVTVGEAGEDAQEIEKTGAIHEVCPPEEYVSDRDHKVLSTPAYMYDSTAFEVFTGISKMIKEFVEMA